MKVQMIICVIVISIAFMNKTHAGVTRAQMENLARGFRSSCVRKTQADMALVEGLRNGQFPEGNTKLKCYTRCIMALMKTLKNDKADLTAVVKQIKAMAADDVADRLVDAAKKCHSEVDDEDPCEYSWKYTFCTYKRDPEIFFFP